MRILPHTQYKTGEEWKGYGYGQTLEYKGKVFSLDAGQSDDISIYHDKDCIYVVSENHSMEYIGLQRFYKDGEHTEADTLFLQNECESKDWLLSISRYPTKIRFMLEYMD